MQSTDAANSSRRRRRIIAVVFMAWAVAVSATYWLQVRRLEVSRDVWLQFLAAIREDDLNRLRSLIDGQSIRLNQNSSVDAALIFDPSGVETRGTIMPLDRLLKFSREYQPQPVTWEDFAQSRLRIGKPASWGIGHFEIRHGRVGFVSDTGRSSGHDRV